jgi:predicted adenylyl cyclase CyaB
MEIEAKIQIQDDSAVRARLRTLGARFIGRYHEVNHILDHPLLELRRRGHGLRVRELDTLDGQPQPATITYKGSVQPGTTFKIRPEINVVTHSPGAAVELFESLGFTHVLSFEKIRESGSRIPCQVEIDELPYLGRFVEVEGPSETSIFELLKGLGCAAAPHIPRSYVSLLLEYCRTAGRSERTVRFEM